MDSTLCIYICIKNFLQLLLYSKTDMNQQQVRKQQENKNMYRLFKYKSRASSPQPSLPWLTFHRWYSTCWDDGGQGPGAENLTWYVICTWCTHMTPYIKDTSSVKVNVQLSAEVIVLSTTKYITWTQSSIVMQIKHLFILN